MILVELKNVLRKLIGVTLTEIISGKIKVILVFFTKGFSLLKNMIIDTITYYKYSIIAGIKTFDQTEAYINMMHEDPRFATTIFKIDLADTNSFKKMHVRYKKELVNLNLEDDINPLELTGAYLSPKEFKEAMLDDNTVVIDARNDYEFDLGHFRGAVRPDIRNFRELPQWMRDHKEEFLEKRVLTYCTGGIRCEKFSGWLVREGFKDVGQLHGGIATYGKDPEVRGDLWDGKMYVFDSRIAVPINQNETVIVGKD